MISDDTGMNAYEKPTGFFPITLSINDADLDQIAHDVHRMLKENVMDAEDQPITLDSGKVRVALGIFLNPFKYQHSEGVDVDINPPSAYGL